VPIFIKPESLNSFMLKRTEPFKQKGRGRPRLDQTKKLPSK